ncbi:hypothetical protein HDE_11080 [Halotydeus destructor]|nr:hypothetical protein HDE_11080 [Halotydeus destructor]
MNDCLLCATFLAVSLYIVNCSECSSRIEQSDKHFQNKLGLFRPVRKLGLGLFGSSMLDSILGQDKYLLPLLAATAAGGSLGLLKGSGVGKGNPLDALMNQLLPGLAGKGGSSLPLSPLGGSKMPFGARQHYTPPYHQPPYQGHSSPPCPYYQEPQSPCSRARMPSRPKCPFRNMEDHFGSDSTMVHTETRSPCKSPLDSETTPCPRGTPLCEKRKSTKSSKKPKASAKTSGKSKSKPTPSLTSNQLNPVVYTFYPVMI